MRPRIRTLPVAWLIAATAAFAASKRLASRPAPPPVAQLTDDAHLPIPDPAADPAETKADQALSRKLARTLPATIRFNSVSLDDAVHFFGDITTTHFTVDWRALAAAGVSPATPVNVDSLHSVTFDQAIEFLLSAVPSQAPLDFEVRHGTIFISTAAELQKITVTRVYNVQQFLHKPVPVTEYHESGPPVVRMDDGSNTVLEIVQCAAAAELPDVDDPRQAGLQITDGKLTVTADRRAQAIVAHLLAELGHPIPGK